MFSIDYLRPIRNLLRVFSADRSPRQIAWGIALGMMIGLVPKGNLVAVGLTMILFSLRTNLGLGLTTAFLVSLAGPSLDQLTHGIGAKALQTPIIYQVLCDAFQRPVVPWTSLNNTIVLGGFLLGILLFYPTMHVSELTAAWLQPHWKQGVRQAKRRLRRKQANAAEPIPAVPVVAGCEQAGALHGGHEPVEPQSPHEAFATHAPTSPQVLPEQQGHVGGEAPRESQGLPLKLAPQDGPVRQADEEGGEESQGGERAATAQPLVEQTVVEETVVEHTVVEHTVVEHTVVEHAVVKHAVVEETPAEDISVETNAVTTNSDDVNPSAAVIVPRRAA
jgi:uncharacterized protein (TIGR03546 family)